MAPRQQIEERTINGYKASFHLDMGGPLGSDHFVTVRPIDEDNSWIINRWFYFDEQNENYAWNFAEKVCTNETYREHSLNETADWSRVNNLYETYEKELYGVLCEEPASEFPIMNDKSRDDKRVLEACCKRMFKEIKSVVRDGVDKHPEQIYEEQEQELQSHLSSKY